MVSFPEGFTSPKRTSVMASAASEPPNQVCRMEVIASFSQASVIGRPENSTRTTGFPVPVKAFSSFFWHSGRLMSVREPDSPLILAASPIAATTTSEFLAADTASLIISSRGRLSHREAFPGVTIFSNLSSSRILQPFAYLRLIPSILRISSSSEG